MAALLIVISILAVLIGTVGLIAICMLARELND